MADQARQDQTQDQAHDQTHERVTFGQRLRTELPDYRVTPSQGLMGDIKALLGPNALLDLPVGAR